MKQEQPSEPAFYSNESQLIFAGSLAVLQKIRQP